MKIKQIQTYLDDLWNHMKQKYKKVQNLEKSKGYNKYDQRNYDNLNNLYANLN